jgi:hypothetical protein
MASLAPFANVCESQPALSELKEAARQASKVKRLRKAKLPGGCARRHQGRRRERALPPWHDDAAVFADVCEKQPADWPATPPVAARRLHARRRRNRRARKFRALFADPAGNAMDISAWLRDLGLHRYEAAFRDNSVDADVFPDLTESDLSQLGVTLGDRKRLLRAIASLSSGPTPASPAVPASASPPAPPSPRDDAERRPITVLFCDLVGSTSMAAKLDPEDWRNFVKAYLDQASAAVTGLGGLVLKKLGDGRRPCSAGRTRISPSSRSPTSWRGSPGRCCAEARLSLPWRRRSQRRD